ncbi:hypothetical protein ABPG72_007908 [Tetrahymena utriculariae]
MLNRSASLIKKCFGVVNKNDNFKYEVLNDKKIGILTLCNPKKRNSLNIQMVKDLSEQFKDIAAQDYSSQNYAKVVILKSEGTVFSAGHDLKEIKELQDKNAFEEQKQLFLRCANMMTYIQKSLPQITIAQVHNFATAAGCQLACSCDLIVASKSASFSCPGVNIGLFCSTPGVAIIRAMANKKKAFEMLVTGDPISAQEAYQHGMINQYVENNEELEKQTLKLAEKIASHSGETLGFGKLAFYKQQNMSDLEQVYDFASSTMAQNLRIEDCVEGIKAFNEKRHAHFKK